MGPLRDIRLSRLGVLILAAVSLAATIVILAGGGSRTNTQLAAETALKHPLSVVEQIQSTHSSAQAGAGDGAGTDISPPASDPSSSDGSGTGSSDTAAASGVSAASGDASGATSSGSAAGASATPSTPSSSAATTPSPTATTTPTATDAGLPKVRHVFLLTLSTTNYRDAFAASSPAPYLRHLVTRGTILSGFHAVGHNGLADLLAMVSGQPPNADTSAGCPRYVAYPQTATLTAAGVAQGKGCVYPDAALTVADQVNAAGQTWGAYVADMGESNCPVPTTGEALDTPLAGTQAGYDVAHNPFAFFGSLLDAGGCSEYDEDLTQLSAALTKPARTPNLTYIGGDACVDADPTLAPTTTATGTTGSTSTSTTTSTTTTTTANSATPATPTDPTGGITATGTGTAADSTASTAADATASTAADTTASTTPDTSTVPARLQVPAAYGCPAGETSGIAGEDAFLKTWVPKILVSAAYRANGVLIIAFTGAKAKADTGALVLSRWTPKHKRVRASYDPYSLLHSIEDMLDLAPLARAAGAPAFAHLVLR